MSAMVARQPLHPLPMSSIQRGPRRLSARLQEIDEPQSNGVFTNGKVNSASNGASSSRRTHDLGPANNKKRKIDYDEEDDGFTFTRLKKRKPRASDAQIQAAPEQDEDERIATTKTTTQPIHNGESCEPARRRRNKMSFSTPKITEPKPVRRSKRYSNENDLGQGSPHQKARRKEEAQSTTAPASTEIDKTVAKRINAPPLERTPGLSTTEIETTADGHSPTRITLPFADTPVIRRNKAMREGKMGKGDRRSSLGLRGRRASSLIETGNSNALPHAEVEVRDFYKHIESESLPEPKRMRQLLTWCATRALSEKPMGTAFEDVSVKQAARIVQEELLNDFANKSEMSDWFGREDAPALSIPLEERPNPKNVQNVEKIKELEEQIKRLRKERDSFESLLHPPAIAPLPEISTHPTLHDRSLLSESDAALLNSLGQSARSSADFSTRLNSLNASLGPTIDAFADGVNKMGQYRDAADNVASRTLAICAEKLSDRERNGRKRALEQEEDRSPKMDLGSILRGLSQIDR